MTAKKVLINGAGGFIGRHLVRRFLEDGYAVRASDVPQADLSWAREAGAETMPSTLEDAEGIDKAVKGCDLVIHTAAIFDLACPAERILRVNVDGTRFHCNAALRHGVERMVLFSTSGVYGVPERIPCTEDTAKRPRNPYEESKWRSELLAMEYHAKAGLPVTALRPTLVYGPGSKYGQAMYLALFLMLRYWGMKTFAVPRGGTATHHVHIDDVVSAVRILAESDGVEGRGFNVADDNPLTSQETMGMLCEATGIGLKVLPSSVGNVMRPVYRFAPLLLGSSIAKLNKRLAKTWPRVVEEYGLKPALQPRLDIGWFGYLYADHRYATEALKSLGWRSSVPHFVPGMKSTIAWYEAEKWIPPLGEIAAR